MMFKAQSGVELAELLPHATRNFNDPAIEQQISKKISTISIASAFSTHTIYSSSCSFIVLFLIHRKSSPIHINLILRLTARIPSAEADTSL